MDQNDEREREREQKEEGQSRTLIQVVERERAGQRRNTLEDYRFSSTPGTVYLIETNLGAARMSPGDGARKSLQDHGRTVRSPDTSLEAR